MYKMNEMEVKIIKYFNIKKRNGEYHYYDSYHGESYKEYNLIYMVENVINLAPHLGIWDNFQYENNITDQELNKFKQDYSNKLKIWVKNILQDCHLRTDNIKSITLENGEYISDYNRLTYSLYFGKVTIYAHQGKEKETKIIIERLND